jgi:hypothetical protein
MLGDIDEMPEPGANYVVFTNLRKRDGKPVNYVSPGAKQIIFPWSRISFLEIMVSAEERREVVDFFRES